MSREQYARLESFRAYPLAAREVEYRAVKESYRPKLHGDYQAYCKAAIEALKL